LCAHGLAGVDQTINHYLWACGCKKNVEAMRHDSGLAATIAAAAAETRRRMLHPCPWPRSGDTASCFPSVYFYFLVDAILSCVVSESQNVSVG